MFFFFRKNPVTYFKPPIFQGSADFSSGGVNVLSGTLSNWNVYETLQSLSVIMMSFKATQSSISQLAPGAWALERLFINNVEYADSNFSADGLMSRNPWLLMDPTKFSIGSWFKCRYQTDDILYFLSNCFNKYHMPLSSQNVRTFLFFFRLPQHSTEQASHYNRWYISWTYLSVPTYEFYVWLFLEDQQRELKSFSVSLTLK